MAAYELEWAPDSLYNTAISAIVTNYKDHRSEIKTLHENAQFDVYYKLYNKGRLCDLSQELCDLGVMTRVLKVQDKRPLLHHCFQAVMDHGHHATSTLSDAYTQHCAIVHTDVLKEKAVSLGFSLAGFLSDAGWFADAEKVYAACLQLIKLSNVKNQRKLRIECSIRMVHARTANCQYAEAESMWREVQQLISEESAHPGGHQPSHSKALLYSECCALHFSKSQYDEAYRYCCLALGEVNSSLPPRTIVDVFRQCSKACVVKRNFPRAELLIKFAVQHARTHFGVKHHKYSDALLDYGFYLLNVDSIFQAVQVYQAALDIRISVFGGNNLHVAVAHEDLAYSSYVDEYSSGKFQDARQHAEQAIEIINHILPSDHLLLASSKRVKALILEEIAIDSHDKDVEKRLLLEAQELHLSSLSLAMKAFGEENVQTAKHYGNLGRLYQSMHRYKEAEEMHLKAIWIKDKLLGPEDYEVALSVGHLASLYNYDMHKYYEAEKLYLRSIAIGRKLFGPGYSGLEYDYRGLLRLYQQTDQAEKTLEYRIILQSWNEIRDRSRNEVRQPLNIEEAADMDVVLKKFFELS